MTLRKKSNFWEDAETKQFDTKERHTKKKEEKKKKKIIYKTKYVLHSLCYINTHYV